jgi:hypothetical protein
VVALAPEDRGGWEGEVPELLPEDRYEEWTVEHRERLAGLRAAALRRQGQWGELLRTDPPVPPAGFEPAISCVKARLAGQAKEWSKQELSSLGVAEVVTNYRPLPGRFGGIWAQLSPSVASGPATGHAPD